MSKAGITGESTTVLVDRAGAVGQITLNRPEALNAITLELAAALEAALDQLAERVDVVVIRGAGENFSVGGDLRYLERIRAERPAEIRTLLETFGRVCGRIATLPVPVIAAVEGYALAGGFELMQASDLAIVRDDARIGDHHARFGLVPGGGSSQRLPRLAGRQRALALLLTGNHLSGTEATSWGLAYRSVASDRFDAAINELAGNLASKSRDALARIKSLVGIGLERSLEDGLALELETVLEHLGGEGGRRGMDEFASRRGNRGKHRDRVAGDE